jgi:autotransporter-associated beta strand protein
MNRTYRLVWNKALRVLQVASEHASAHGGAATGASDAPPRLNLLWLALLASGGFAAAGSVVAQTCVPSASSGCSAPGGGVPVFATGDGAGSGGAGNGMGGAALHYGVTLAPANQAAGGQSLNGAGGAGASGVQTSSGVTVLGGAGGAPGDFFAGTLGQGGNGGDGTSHGESPSGGGGGGAGEYATYPGLSVASGTNLLGGAGGNGGSMLAGNGFGAGGGGGGGAGIVSVASNFSLGLQANVSITGGAGGQGGNNTQPGVAFSGGGGGGGDGVLLFGADTYVYNAGTITGGVGGAAGTATGPVGTAGAGASGAGIRALNTGLTLINTGTVRGGALTGNGAAGAGVITQGGATINNSGTLAGGASGAGYASAVVFNGTGSTLNLMAGSVIHGLVELNANATATLATTTAASLEGVKLNGGTAAVRFNVVNGGNNINVNGPLTGTGNVTSEGAGYLLLGGVNLTGALSLSHTGGVTTSGTVTTTGAQYYASAVALNGPRVINSGSSIDFAGGFAGGSSLSVTAAGNITANAAVTLNGAGAFLATGHDISLGNSGNVMFGEITATGRHIMLATANALQIAKIDSTGNTVLASPNTVLYGDVTTLGILTFNGGSAIQAAGTVQANTLAGALSGDLLLNNVGNGIRTLGTLSARDVTLGGVMPLSISGNVNVRSINLSSFAPTTLTGTLQSTGNVVLPIGGELRVGTGTTTGALNGNIVNSGTLIFNRSTASAYGHALSGDGAVRKQGAGTLFFDGSATGFSGTTTVQAGRLVVGSSAGSSAMLGGAGVTVNAGATLGGHGTLDTNVVVQSGARLAPGNSIGTLTVTGDLQLQQGATLDFELGAPNAVTPFAAAGQGDSVVVGGSLSINNAVLNISDGGGFGAGLYRLFTWGNTLTLTNGGFASIPQGNILQILGASRQINLIVPGNTPLQFWNANGQAAANSAGGGSGVWSNTAPVWTDAQGALTSTMSPNPGNAIFAGDAGTVTVSSGNGAVSAQSLQFASDGYVLSGDALTLVADSQGAAPVIRVGDGSVLGAGYTTTISSVLAGSAGLQKTDLGTLVLTAANTWTGTTRIAGGTLSVAGESALGDASAALLLDGGVLQVTGTGLGQLQRNVALGNAGGGFDIADADHTFVLDQTLTGSGALLKRGDGTLLLQGAQRYSGGTVVEAGTLQGDTESLQGSIVNNASLVVEQDSNGTLAADVAGSGALTKRGTGTVRLAGNNTYTGGTFIEAGTLQGSASALRGPIQNDGTLVLDRNEDSVLADAFTGTGRLLKTGTGTLVVQQAQGYAGSTQVEQGTLVVGDASTANATLGGSVSIGQGARLQGIGRVGSLDLQGTLAPGNSIGTLHVSGNAVLQASARYEVDVDADGRHDQLAVDGTTTILGGSVVSLADGAAWNPLTRYTLITSEGGVTGRFNTVSNNLAFLTPTLEYAATSVTLALARNEVAFPAVGTTYNQRSTATALESLGSGALYDRVVVMDEGSARQAFDAYSGEVHASTQVTLLDDAARVRRSLANRLVGADAGSSEGSSANGWATAWGHRGSNDADGNAARGRQQGTGWMAGADLGFENEAVLGVAVGQARSTLEVDARSADARTNSKYAGLYGGVGFGTWALRGGLTGGSTDSRIQRRAADQQLHSTDDARLWQGFVDVAHGSTVGRLHLEPYLNYAHVRLEQDGFQEWGGAAALVGNAQTRTLDIGTAGLRTQWHLDSRFSTAVVLNLGYQRAWGDTTSALSQQFAAGGAAFLVNGLPVEEKAGVAELGFTTQLTPRVEFRADYQGRFGSSVRDQGAQLTVRAQF